MSFFAGGGGGGGGGVGGGGGGGGGQAVDAVAAFKVSTNMHVKSGPKEDTECYFPETLNFRRGKHKGAVSSYTSPLRASPLQVS